MKKKSWIYLKSIYSKAGNSQFLKSLGTIENAPVCCRINYSVPLGFSGTFLYDFLYDGIKPGKTNQCLNIKAEETIKR